MRLFVFPALLLVPACAPMVSHGPVSPKVLAQMETGALSKKEFVSRINRASPPPAATVTLPLKMILGVPVLKASLNGQGLTEMMLDTGASRSMIQADLAVKKGIPVLRAEEATVELQGVVGKELSRIGLVGSLHLGAWDIQGYPCLVRTYENKLGNLAGSESFPESLLGFDIGMAHAAFMTIDYKAETVTYGFTKGKFVPSRPQRASMTPFIMDRGVPFVKVTSGEVSWKAIVDTGSFNGIEIDKALATRLGVQNQGERVHGIYLMAVGGTTTSTEANMRTVRLRQLQLMGGNYREADVDISPGIPRIGSHFLKDYKVTFDFQRRELWLEW